MEWERGSKRDWSGFGDDADAESTGATESLKRVRVDDQENGDDANLGAWLSELGPIENTGDQDWMDVSRFSADPQLPDDQVAMDDAFNRVPDGEQSCQVGGVLDNLETDDLETDDVPSAARTPAPDQEIHNCFGMLTVDVTCSPSSSQNFHAGPVLMEPSGSGLRLSFAETNAFAGFIDAPVLAKLARESKVMFEAMLPEPSKKLKKGSQDAFKSSTPTVAAQVVVYGSRADMYDVGDALSDAGFYLQHPTLDIDPHVKYFNPQYLLAPGETFPNPSRAAAPSRAIEQPHEALLRLRTMNQLNQVFDAANGPGLGQYTMVKQSKRLKTTLEEHQMIALAMMVEKECGVIDEARFDTLWLSLQADDGTPRYEHVVTGRVENQAPPPVLGGILGDEMGLGKSLSALALIAWYLDRMEPQEAPTSPRATLIVTPKSTMPGWQQQVRRHLLPGQIRSVIYHGPTRQSLSATLKDYDLVLTTYDLLRSEWTSGAPGGLFQAGLWSRVVLDEAHRIRDSSTATHRAACALQATHRWCLTGTPIQNRLEDYSALLKFLRVPPFTVSRMFDYWITSAISKHPPEGLRRLRKLVGATCLRRTKKVLQGRLQLPRRVDREELVDLSPEDRDLYDFFRGRTASILSGLLSADSANPSPGPRGNVLTMINILRRICNHGKLLLPRSAIQIYQDRYRSQSDCDDLDCQDETDDTHSNGENCFPSAKVISLVENLAKEQRQHTMSTQGTPVKSVVFSFWTGMLDSIEAPLRRDSFSFVRIDGSSSLKQRTETLKSFNEDPNCTVLLASLSAVGEGVDLTAANYVHLMEPHWNPMAEAQALDRVHRIGQTRDVVTTRYIVKNSIETYVQNKQRSMIDIIEQSLGNSRENYQSIWKNLLEALNTESEQSLAA